MLTNAEKWGVAGGAAAVIGVVVALVAWQFPVSPSSSSTNTSPTPQATELSSTVSNSGPLPTTATTISTPTVTPSLAPAQTVYLASDDPVRVDCDSFYYHDNDGSAVMAVNGKNYLHVVSMGRDGDIGEDEPGPCSREYNLGRKYVNISGTAGVADVSDSKFSCVVDILVDGTKRWSSGELRLGTSKPLRAKISGGLRVKIDMTFVGPGYGECALGDLLVSS